MFDSGSGEIGSPNPKPLVFIEQIFGCLFASDNFLFLDGYSKIGTWIHFGKGVLGKVSQL